MFRAESAKFAEKFSSLFSARSENAPHLFRVGQLLRSRRMLSGQSLIESCLVIAILCLVLFGGMQVSQLYMAHEVLDNAALCGARARSVGLNDFMVDKTIRVASIPVAGRLVRPAYVSNPYSIIPAAPNRIGGAWDTALRSEPSSDQFRVEYIAIESYFSANDGGQASGFLDYELEHLDQWGRVKETVDFANVVTKRINETSDAVEVTVKHRYPLNWPFHQAFFDGDVDLLVGKATIEKHYDLYLE
jgi:hypothetical protein